MSKTILIVEDEMVLQDVYKLLISSAGYLVYTASNGADALKLLPKTKPDLILLDLFMPIMNGETFLKKVDLGQYPHTKVVVSTNMSDSETEARVMKLGAHKFVLKSSMAPNDLLRLVAEMTNS